MANFIGMVYGTLKEKGIDTSGMSTEEAINKFNELQSSNGKSNGKGGSETSNGVDRSRYNAQEWSQLEMLDNVQEDFDLKDEDLDNWLFTEFDEGDNPTQFESTLENGDIVTIDLINGTKTIDKQEDEELDNDYIETEEDPFIKKFNEDAEKRNNELREIYAKDKQAIDEFRKKLMTDEKFKAEIRALFK